MLETQFASPKSTARVSVFPAASSGVWHSASAPVHLLTWSSEVQDWCSCVKPGHSECEPQRRETFLSSGAAAAAANTWSESKQELEGVDAMVSQESASILLSQALQKFSLSGVKSLPSGETPLQWNVLLRSSCHFAGRLCLLRLRRYQHPGKDPRDGAEEVDGVKAELFGLFVLPRSVSLAATVLWQSICIPRLETRRVSSWRMAAHPRASVQGC